MATAELTEWSKEVVNQGLITCRVKNAPAVTYDTLGRDCSEHSKKLTCGEFNEPIGCKMLSLEEARIKQAAEAAKK